MVTRMGQLNPGQPSSPLLCQHQAGPDVFDGAQGRRVDASNPEVELRQHEAKIAGRLAFPRRIVVASTVLAGSRIGCEVPRLIPAVCLHAVAVAKLSALFPPCHFVVKDFLGIIRQPHGLDLPAAIYARIRVVFVLAVRSNALHEFFVDDPLALRCTAPERYDVVKALGKVSCATRSDTDGQLHRDRPTLDYDSSLATVELTIISILLGATLQLNRSAVAGLEYRLALDRTQWYRDFLPSNLH